MNRVSAVPLSSIVAGLAVLLSGCSAPDITVAMTWAATGCEGDVRSVAVGDLHVVSGASDAVVG